MMSALEKFLMMAGKGVGDFARSPTGQKIGSAVQGGVQAVRNNPKAAALGAGGGAGVGYLMGDDDAEDMSDEELVELLRQRGMYA